MLQMNDAIFRPSAPYQPVDNIPNEPFSPDDTARIQIALSKKLGPEHISSRRGMGSTRLAYIEGWRIISIANEVFGFNGWRSNLFNMVVDFVDVDPKTNNVSIGLSCMVRVTLRDGTYREDCGYGIIENCRSKAQAFEKVRKEAVTDALKRAMRQFGNVLGNCIYDKEFLRHVSSEPKQPRTTMSGSTLFRNCDLDGRLVAAGPGAVATPTSNQQVSPVPVLTTTPAQPPLAGHTQATPAHEVRRMNPAPEVVPMPGISAQAANSVAGASIGTRYTAPPKSEQQHASTCAKATTKHPKQQRIASAENNNIEADLDDILSGIDGLTDDDLLDVGEPGANRRASTASAASSSTEASLEQSQLETPQTRAQLPKGGCGDAVDLDTVNGILSDIDWSDIGQADLFADLESNRPVVPESPVFPYTDEPPLYDSADPQQMPESSTQGPCTRYSGGAQSSLAAGSMTRGGNLTTSSTSRPQRPSVPPPNAVRNVTHAARHRDSDRTLSSNAHHQSSTSSERTISAQTHDQRSNDSTEGNGRSNSDFWV
ncbi:hypothetical protein DL89DRAFT_265556 [Linderina pennispora]|uniref:Recombination protein Rad52 n=1 Tax=Linderina pennispora TaxID=61395 RepID=A0A1Y1WEC8_9FUNG|nr:uncharacterized protein DL89DRAFT_265556 [Linderina pennispora]ORX71843.1 hypothetical protein DL89DRAFT_265556 [Linderina pennispora]